MIKRSGSANGALSADFNIVAGNATSGADYSGATAGTLTWSDGDANPKWIEYTISADGSGEGNEFFELRLSNVSGGSIGPNANLRVDILDGTGFNSAPNSVAGASQVVGSGAMVTLNGSGSNDPDGDNLSYAWSQTLGPTVTLSNANTATASFRAPSVNSDTVLRFALQVTDPGGLGDTSTVNVTVSSSSGGGSPGGSGGATLDLWMLFGLLGFASLRRKGVS